MIKMNLNRPYANIYGHAAAVYEQDGNLYDGEYKQLKAAPTAPEPPNKYVTETDPLANAKAFLKAVLSTNTVSKSAIFKEAENNNQPWSDVKDAADALGILKSNHKNLEMWRLP